VEILKIRVKVTQVLVSGNPCAIFNPMEVQDQHQIQGKKRFYCTLIVEMIQRFNKFILIFRPNATYVAVSEASDDMYAAIEDPTYIPTGAVSQTNSDTYAVINPDYDSGSQTYQKLQGQYEVRSRVFENYIYNL
jgi:hypothetical protein